MTTLAFVVIDPAAERSSSSTPGTRPRWSSIPRRGRASSAAGRGPAGRLGGGALRGRDASPSPTGTIVLLYTDGLVERRGESIEEGLERLRALAEGARDAEDLCARSSSGSSRERPTTTSRSSPPACRRWPTHADARWPAHAGDPGRHPPPAAPLAAERAADEGRPTTSSSPPRRRARTRSSTPTGPGAREFGLEAICDGRPRRDHGARPRPVASAARREPRPRPAR